jgi:putative transcriptional regulator
MSAGLRGNLLVAASHLRDPSFYRSVVLMVDHNDDSAMGLIINRPDSIAIDEAIDQAKKSKVGMGPVYAGGPVDTSSLFILHSCIELGRSDEEIASDIFVTGSHESFNSLINKNTDCQHDCSFRVYRGYAGWGPEQLEGELDRGDWRIMPAAADIVFKDDPYEIWEACTRWLQKKNRLLPHDVPDAEWN